ncbi:glutathione peroxidase [Ilumatobacter coccineus YM16-304]|uniref:Glutathione peroxidase n=1 Tax=Ilumatobacter coccineus (strain NBRC 103263 / KCTC 29153 / YM16-304) TaxID=1313172 RepID=A0A6C7E6R6_ILUCY|nr:glutathione peroxidase [Ilumatobacter coccineus YM16-304]
MFSKVDVNGENQAPLYALLKDAQPGDGDSPDITWNFEKFLVNGDGDVVKRWAPPTTPEDIGAELDDFR